MQDSDTDELNDNETTIENMTFKKLDLDSLEIENLDSDIEFDDLDLTTIKKVDNTDISNIVEDTTTHKNLTQDKNTKTIIIEEDKLNPISKFSKPKKKSFKFFD